MADSLTMQRFVPRVLRVCASCVIQGKRAVSVSEIDWKMKLYRMSNMPSFIVQTPRWSLQEICPPVLSNRISVCVHFLKSKLQYTSILSRQIIALSDLCCIVIWRLLESVGSVFDPVVSSAIAVLEHVNGELAVPTCLLLATL